MSALKKSGWKRRALNALELLTVHAEYPGNAPLLKYTPDAPPPSPSYPSSLPSPSGTPPTTTLQRPNGKAGSWSRHPMRPNARRWHTSWQVGTRRTLPFPPPPGDPPLSALSLPPIQLPVHCRYQEGAAGHCAARGTGALHGHPGGGKVRQEGPPAGEGGYSSPPPDPGSPPCPEEMKHSGSPIRPALAPCLPLALAPCLPWPLAYLHSQTPGGTCATYPAISPPLHPTLLHTYPAGSCVLSSPGCGGWMT